MCNLKSSTNKNRKHTLLNQKLMQRQNYVPSKFFKNKCNIQKDTVYLVKNKANTKNDRLLEVGIIDKNSHKIFKHLITSNNKNIIKSLNRIDINPIAFGSRIERSRKIVKQHVAAAVAGGFIPSVAGSAATLIGNEIVMTSRIGYEYGYRDLKKQLKAIFKGAYEGGKTSIMTIPLTDKASSVVVQQLAQLIQKSLTAVVASSASKFIPLVGLAVNSTIAAFATEDLGNKVIDYFEVNSDSSQNKKITYISNSDNISDSDSIAETIVEKEKTRDELIEEIDCLKYKSPEEYIEQAAKICNNDFENSSTYLLAKGWVEYEETNTSDCDGFAYCRAVYELEMAISDNYKDWEKARQRLLKKWENQWAARLHLLNVVENSK